MDPLALSRLRALSDAVARPGEDVLGRLLQIFIEDSRARLTVLQAAAAKGDVVEGARMAHNMKGAAANMGALRVVAAAVAVEACCRSQLDAVPRSASRVGEFTDTASRVGELSTGSSPGGDEFAAQVTTLAEALEESWPELRRSFARRE